MADVAVKKSRPKHLNLMQIRLPLAGIVSILHRVSGAGLFLCLPLLIWLLDASLGAPEQLEAFRTVIGSPLVKLILFGLLWAYLHHFCAGIRFLFLDIHKGIELPAAHRTSIAVLVVSLGLTLLIGGAALW